jgi:hypothetical protein
MKNVYLMIGLVILLAAGMSGCNGNTQPTAVPLIDPVDPGVQPPLGAPVRENASLMGVEVLSISPNEKNSAEVIIHVKVVSSAAANGMDEYDPNLVGQEIDIHLNAADAVNLAAGSTLNLTVSYRGDEWGGGYYGSNLTLEMAPSS